MSDKGFPIIKSIEKVITVIPPKTSKFTKQFTKQQMDETAKIASVRIHVERVIQRLKNFRILTHRLDFSLLPVVDMIVHMCAVLVNTQSPIIKEVIDKPSEIDNESDTVQNCDFSSSSESDS